MTWRGDGDGEGLRTIVPPIVDRLVVSGWRSRAPEVQKSILAILRDNCAK